MTGRWSGCCNDPHDVHVERVLWPGAGHEHVHHRLRAEPDLRRAAGDQLRARHVLHVRGLHHLHRGQDLGCAVLRRRAGGSGGARADRLRGRTPAAAPPLRQGAPDAAPVHLRLGAPDERRGEDDLGHRPVFGRLSAGHGRRGQSGFRHPAAVSALPLRGRPADRRRHVVRGRPHALGPRRARRHPGPRDAGGARRQRADGLCGGVHHRLGAGRRRRRAGRAAHRPGAGHGCHHHQRVLHHRHHRRAGEHVGQLPGRAHLRLRRAVRHSVGAQLAGRAALPADARGADRAAVGPARPTRDGALTMPSHRQLIASAIVVLLLALIPLAGSRYAVDLTTEVLIYALFALSLNVLIGFTGNISFGHAAYFAMVTLAFAMLVWGIAFKWKEVTGGDDGLTGIKVPAMLTNHVNYFYFTLAVVSAGIAALWVICHSAFGLTLVAIRENSVRAGFIGVDTRRMRWAAFTVAGTFGGLAGALFGMYHRGMYIENAFWTESANVLIMVLLGGIYSFVGPIIGAAVLHLLQVFTNQYTPYWPTVLGLILLVIVMVLPDGLIGLARRVKARGGRS